MGAGGKTALAVLRHFTKTPMRALGFVSSVAAMLLVALVVYILTNAWVLALVCCIVASQVFLLADWLIAILEWVEPEVVWRMKNMKKPLAALTIDDIPLLDNEGTTLKQILEVLKKHDVKATLMVMSGCCCDEEGPEQAKREALRELLRQAVKDGHELANHMKFDRPAIAQTNEAFDADFMHCDAFLKKMAGGEEAWQARKWRWFRPASAIWNDHMLKRAKEYGYRTVISNCFPFDTIPVSRHWNSHYLTNVVTPGSVIVIHDREHVDQTLEKALPAIRKRGMQLVPLSEMADAHEQAQQEKKKRARYEQAQQEKKKRGLWHARLMHLCA